MWTGGSLASQPDLLAGIRPTRDLFSKKKKKWICHRNITRKKGFILTYMSRRMESIVAEKTWQQAGSNADGSRDLVGHQSRCGGWGGGAGCVCVGGCQQERVPGYKACLKDLQSSLTAPWVGTSFLGGHFTSTLQQWQNISRGLLNELTLFWHLKKEVVRLKMLLQKE